MVKDDTQQFLLWLESTPMVLQAQIIDLLSVMQSAIDEGMTMTLQIHLSGNGKDQFRFDAPKVSQGTLKKLMLRK